MASNFGLQTASGHLEVPEESKESYPADVEASFREDAAAIIARYPEKRSALLPMLHLVQSVDGYVTGRGIDLCAELLDLSTAEVSGVATFYTQYKRHPNGTYTVGVCTNTLCAIMGGDEIWDAVSEHLGIGHDETTADGMITLERVECNAACDYAPVVMTNWEFFDNQTPESTIQLVDDLIAGKDVAPSRGPATVQSFKSVSRTLAGFSDGLADEGVGAGPASIVGLEIAKEHGWEAPHAAVLTAADETSDSADETATDTGTTGTGAAAGKGTSDSDGDAPGRTEVTQKSDEAKAGTQAAPESTDPADEASSPAAADEDEVTDADSAANEGEDVVDEVGATEGEDSDGSDESTLFSVDKPAEQPAKKTTARTRKRTTTKPGQQPGKDQA